MSRPVVPTFHPGFLSVKLWLLTNLFGWLGWLVRYVFASSINDWAEKIALTIVITFFSTLTSIPTIPVATWLFASIVTFPIGKRLTLAVFAVLLLWLLSVATTSIIIPGPFEDIFSIMQLATPHLVAAFVATAFVYRHWLFRLERLDTCH